MSKTTLTPSSVGREGVDLPLEKWIHFFMGPWLLVCKFIEISNQMEATGEVLKNLTKNFMYHIKEFFSMLKVRRQLASFDWKFL